MPGYELIGKEEQEAAAKVFTESGGVLFAHGFDKARNGIFRVRDFEKEICATVKSPYCQVVSSGSAALIVAMRAVGVGSGDEVITSCYTFVATVEAILEVGAIPVLAEVDDTFNLDPAHVSTLITSKTKAIMPVHMAGAPADMGQICAIAKNNNLLVIEDAAQGFGATYKGEFLGTLGDAGCYSFDFGKCITSGEGGAVVTSVEQTFKSARALHDHGHEYNKDLPRGRDTRSSGGFNYRMTEIQAAIGSAQLKKLSRILETQQKHKRQIKSLLQGIGLEFRRILDANEIADTIIFSVENPENANKIVESLAANGFGTKNIPDATDWHFAETWSHMSASFKHVHSWPKTAALLSKSVAIPVNVLMTQRDIEGVTQVIQRVRS